MEPIEILGRRVVAQNPRIPIARWVGRAVAYIDTPSYLIEQSDGSRLALDAGWVQPVEDDATVEPTTATAPIPARMVELPADIPPAKPDRMWLVHGLCAVAALSAFVAMVAVLVFVARGL